MNTKENYLIRKGERMKDNKVIIEFNSWSDKEDTRKVIEEKILPKIYDLVWNVNAKQNYKPIKLTIEERE